MKTEGLREITPFINFVAAISPNVRPNVAKEVQKGCNNATENLYHTHHILWALLRGNVIFLDQSTVFVCKKIRDPL